MFVENGTLGSSGFQGVADSAPTIPRVVRGKCEPEKVLEEEMC